MDVERRRRAAEVLCAGGDFAAEQRMAAGIIAMRLKLRPQKALKLPPEKMAGYLISVGGIDEQLAGSLMRAYLFGCHEAMLAKFLDDLKIAHNKGVIQSNTTVNLEPEVLKAAVEHLRAEFAAEDVNVYLMALLASDEETWGPLKEYLPKAEAEASGS